MKNEIQDNYFEHPLHRFFDKKCSTCFSKRLQKAEGCGLAYTGDLDLKGYPEFIGTQDQWEAFGNILEGDERAKMSEYKLELCKNCSIPSQNIYCETCQREIENGSDYYEKQEE